MFDRSRLPTAPKASRGPEVDMDRIPPNGPFTAFVGNLAYEVTVEKLEEFFNNRKLEVTELFFEIVLVLVLYMYGRGKSTYICTYCILPEEIEQFH
jgi:hypothetical protein